MKSKIKNSLFIAIISSCLTLQGIAAYPTVSANSNEVSTLSTNTTTTTTTTDNFQDGHVYVLGDLGYGSIDMGPQPTGNAPGGGLSWNVGGGYLWHKQSFAYGPELSYTSLPSVNYLTGTIYGNSVNFMVVGEFALNSFVSAVGKVGPAIVTQTYNSNVTTRFMPTMYIGGKYNVDQHVALNLGYQYVAGASPMYAVLGGVTITV